jgi:hypothetical protein
MDSERVYFASSLDAFRALAAVCRATPCSWVSVVIDRTGSLDLRFGRSYLNDYQILNAIQIGERRPRAERRARAERREKSR